MSTDTQELKVGREMDALVAEKVMGFRRVIVPKDYDGLNEGETLVPPGFDETSTSAWAPKGKYAFEAFAPRYSTDMASAWEVHLAMCNKRFSVRRNYFDAIQDQTRQTESNGVDTYTIAWPDVLVVLRHRFPEAICLAALKAVSGSPTE